MCAYFKGFSTETIDFLKNILENNNKEWFEANRKVYTEHLLNPMQCLVMDLSDFILSIDPNLETRPSVDKTISRIYRDTRFSKDKSPYKSRMWITFKRPEKNWHSNPSFFFELTPFSYSFGMGYFIADSQTMELFRNSIDNKPEKFNKAISFYSKQNTFKLEGDKYKRILDKSKSQDLLEWYQRKNLFLICTREIDDLVFSDALVDELKSSFSLVTNFYHYLYKLKE